MLNHLLVMRLALTTTLSAAAVLWAHGQGLIAPLFVGDASRLSYVIVALFAAGLISTFIRAGRVSAALNDMKGGYAKCFLRRKAAKMEAKNNHIEAVAGWLVTLGLLGTVAGFSIALSGIDVDAFATADGVQRSAAQLLGGMQTAIGTTLVGGFLGMLTEVHYVMLRNATVALVEDVAA